MMTEQIAASEQPVFHPCPADPDCPYCNGPAPHTGDTPDWSFLDGAYCISLKSREDRAGNVAREFHRLGLCQHVTFYRPVKHPVKGIIGSWESHRAVATDALERGYAKTLIMEDDVLFSKRLRAATVRSIAHAIDRLPPDWMIFFLGHWPVSAFLIRHNVLRTSSACAHAYIVSPRLLQWLCERPWGTPGIKNFRLVGKALDSAYAELPGTYALFPMVATQSVSRSDNFNFQTNKKPMRKLKHLVTHSPHREWLLSNLMRPNEMIIVALSPLFLAKYAAIRLYAWFSGQPVDTSPNHPG
jgi:GR25 family glycosyltransferase involved in LPS biosynthesis